MNAPLNDGPALARAAADALRRGDARAARDLFLQAAQAGQADVAVMLGLAYSCRSLQDWAGMGASVDRVLALDPRNVRALVMKGDGFEQAGNSRAASAYYRALWGFTPVAFSSALPRTAAIIPLDSMASLPPLKITALPDFTQRPAASAVTFGRAS